MEFGGRCNQSGRAEMDKIKFHQDKVTLLTNELVDSEMINSVGIEIEKCEDILCEVCPYLYDKVIIVNKNDIYKYWVNKRFNCKGFKEGIYCLICIKPDCEKRGVVYWGQSENVKQRLKEHIYVAGGRPRNRISPCEEHFLEHDANVGEGDDNLKFFKCALVHEVLEFEETVVEVDDETREEKEVKVVWKGELARKKVENLYMNSFRTRGRFGFNHAQARFEMPTVESTTPKRRKLDEPKSETVEYVGHSDSGRCVAKEMTVSEFLLAALAMRNYTTVRDKPLRPPKFVTTEEITMFLNTYFVRDGINTTTTTEYIRANVNKTTTMKSYVVTNWFTGENIGNNWIYRLNPDTLWEIELAIDREKLKLVLLDPTNLDALLAGTLQPPLAKTTRAKRF